MNETLYSSTFKFHKVVRQQNSGMLKDYILPYSATYLRIQSESERIIEIKVIVKK